MEQSNSTETTSLAEINKRLMDLPNQAMKVFKEWHQAKTKFENIKELKEQMKAVISMKYEGSETAIRRKTEADPDWKEYLEGLNAARKDYNQWAARHKYIEIELSTLQSVSKNVIQELKLNPIEIKTF